MTNFRSDKVSDLNIYVNKITVASKVYEVKPFMIQDAVNMIDESTSKIGHGIGCREQVSMHYLIRPIVPNKFKSAISSCSLGDSRALEIENGSKVTDFMCLEYAHDKFKVNNSM